MNRDRTAAIMQSFGVQPCHVAQTDNHWCREHQSEWPASKQWCLQGTDELLMAIASRLLNNNI